MQLFRKGNNLILETIPDVNKSYVLLRLSLEDNLATGTWEDTTEPDGYYKGATYHGAIQLVVSNDGKRMRGLWIGAGKDLTINTGPWEFEYIGATLLSTAKGV